MRRFVFLALFLPFSAALAQSPLHIPLQQCVWRAGDNLAWVAPETDESGWHPYTDWRMNGRSPYIWVRCHADLSPLAGLPHPALQVEFGRAFQVFLNGRQVGSSGNFSAGWYTDGLAPVFPVHEPPGALEHGVIALRIAYRAFEESEPVRVTAGEAQWLKDQHDSVTLVQSRRFQPVEICYLAIGFAGFLLLGMYLNDRRRLELLLLAACCWCQLINRTTEYISIAAVPVPFAFIATLFVIGQCVAWPQVWFVFRLAGKRVPWFFRLLIVGQVLYPTQILLGLLLPSHLSLRVSGAFYSIFSLQIAVDALTTLMTPLVAFWPWNHVGKRLRGLALCCLLWLGMEATWLGFVVFTSAFAEEATMARDWADLLLLIRAFATLAVVIALVALLFRDQRRTAEERALLAGEMQAAREIQRMLVQPAIESVPGIRIEVAFHPMREVGGDFYVCRVLPGNRQRILVGDVSGKGAAAAMTATLLIGASEDRDPDSPAALLRHLNTVLHSSRVGGFATCLCADVAHDGTVTLANAGHLAPYCHDQEISVPAALPLGVAPPDLIVWEETHFTVTPGDTLTFLSDGVVEARSPSGELFGFERTRAISTQSVEKIAAAAQAFGQEDDITVLRLEYAGAEVAYA